MRRQILTTLTIVPLLFMFAEGSQNWTAEQPGWSYSYSDEAGTGAYLGVDISDVTTDRLGALKLKDEEGVEITMVDQDAPAGKAGLKEHDVILTMNGTAVESAAQLRRMIHETPPDRVVTLGISRNGQPMTVKVQLADRRKEFSPFKNENDMHIEIPPIPPMPPMPAVEMPNINVVIVHSSLRSGLSVENITPQLGDFFGIKNGKGVLIRSVEKGSRADKAGFRAGDVIVRVNGQTVRDTSDFMNAIRMQNGAVAVGIVRDKREQKISLPLPDHKNSGQILEESLDGDPVMNADSYLELGEMKDELAKLQPQMELAIQEARQAAEQMRKEACSQKNQLLEQSRALRALKPEIRKGLDLEHQKLNKELERMQHEMSGDWLDI